MKIKILDFNYQLSRIFGKFLSNEEFDNPETSKFENYDVIVCHRDGIQDNFDNIKKFCKKNTKIVVDVTTESGSIQDFLDRFFTITNEYTDYIFYLIIDTDVNSYIEEVKPNYTVISGYDLIFYAFLNDYSDNTMHNNDKIDANKIGFISLNNTARIHRVLFLFQILKRNLDLTNCSFLFTSGGDTGYSHNKQVYNECIKRLLNENLIDEIDIKNLDKIKIPKILDFDISEPNYIKNNINFLYENLVNIVTENLSGLEFGDVSSYGIITFTEKTIKPFLAKQIPIFYGLSGFLSVLRKLGFDLFDDLIDLSYDLESDHKLRMNLILDELEKILKMDLIEFKKHNYHRFQHNYDLIQTLTDSGEEKIKTFLYQEILK